MINWFRSRRVNAAINDELYEQLERVEKERDKFLKSREDLWKVAARLQEENAELKAEIEELREVAGRPGVDKL